MSMFKQLFETEEKDDIKTSIKKIMDSLNTYQNNGDLNHAVYKDIKMHVKQIKRLVG